MSNDRGEAMTILPAQLTCAIGTPGTKPKNKTAQSATMRIPAELLATISIDLHHDGRKYRLTINQCGEVRVFRHEQMINGEPVLQEMYHGDRIKPLIQEMKGHLKHIVAIIPEPGPPRGVRVGIRPRRAKA